MRSCFAFRQRAATVAAQVHQWFQRQRARITTAVLVVMLGLMAGPTLAPQAQSFSIDTSNLLTTAADWFNSLWPIFAIIAGLGLGIALVTYVVRAIQSAFG